MDEGLAGSRQIAPHVSLPFAGAAEESVIKLKSLFYMPFLLLSIVALLLCHSMCQHRRDLGNQIGRNISSSLS